MVKILVAISLILLSGCSVIVIKHEEGSLPKVEFKDNEYFCKNGKTKIDVDSDEIVVSCRIKI